MLKEEPENFQDAMDTLEEVTRQLESGELPLEDAMQKYSEARELIDFCEQRLEEAELLVQEVDDPGSAEPSLSPKEEPDQGEP